MKNRYLTKSRFSLALECPTKLFYSGKQEYSNLKSEDSFLKALAEGGFQVGALAKCYYPDGIQVDAVDPEDALLKTNELLQREEVVIFEAAICYKNLFIRTDILIKNGNHLTLIEVKAKSVDSTEKSPFTNKKGIDSTWKKYISDVAFQKFVLLKAFPEYRITSYLMLADKSSTAKTNGLNQKFRIKRENNGKTKIIASKNITKEDLSTNILCKINVDSEIELIFKEEFRNNLSFSQFVDYLSEQYSSDKKVPPIPGSFCKKCEFKTSQKQKNPNLKSGYKECWSEVFSFTENDFAIPNVLDIWNFSKKDKLIKAGIVKISQINEDDISPEPDGKPGWSAPQRRWLQVEKVKNGDTNVSIDVESLKSEINSWVYPFHFIDFETCMTAIPLNNNERPYQGLAFQFSHHVLYSDGRVEHVGQFLSENIGQNPNIEFIRILKYNLEKDNGTIFRYATHENSYLNMIHDFLLRPENYVSDRDQLISFIKTISKSKKDSKEKWEGERNMVDLCEVVKRFYYDPVTNGSNSIKQVFPAILSRSQYLQKKYVLPIYGSPDGIPSLNFKDWQWVQYNENGGIIDPYTLLPELFLGLDIKSEEVDFFFNDENIKEGGTASTAYARLQFSEMNDIERKGITEGLLKYCELDTLAMVMIVEEWIHSTSKS